MNNNIFIYKLTTDNGGAPCVKDGLLSLAICKPRIRKSAGQKDFIIGMGAKSVNDLKGRLIYIAEVTKIIQDGDYYLDKYSDRPDCIYAKKGQVFNWRFGAQYHSPADLTHDLGEQPYYERAICLLSDKFVYFGRNKEPSIEKIKDIYSALPRDYRVNHNNDTKNRLQEFIDEIFDKYGNGKHGDPTHLDMSKKCNGSEDEIMLCTSRC